MSLLKLLDLKTRPGFVELRAAPSGPVAALFRLLGLGSERRLSADRLSRAGTRPGEDRRGGLLSGGTRATGGAGDRAGEAATRDRVVMLSNR